MGRIHKLLIKSCLKGILIGWIFLAILLGFNIGGLGELVFDSSNPILAPFLLAVGFAITFGNAAMGHAVMTMDKSGKTEE